MPTFKCYKAEKERKMTRGILITGNKKKFMFVSPASVFHQSAQSSGYIP